MEIKISFPGGKRVNAQVGPFVIETDQPPELGGSGMAPAPYELFLASIGTCAGIYVLGFCHARGIATDGLALIQRNDIDPATKMLRAVRLEVRLPPEFPEKYRIAIVKAAEGCKVKKTVAAAPAVEVVLSDDGGNLRLEHHKEVAACVDE